MNCKKILASALTALLLVTPAGAYTAQRSYNGEFRDVAANAWYYDEVASAYSLGLISGTSASTFEPDATLTIAQTIKLAASCHQLITVGAASNIASSTSAWYGGYVDYATINGIVTEEYPDYNAPATRGQVAVLFSRALISAKGNMDEINTAAFGTLPDVDTAAWYSAAVYRTYRWGLMTGDEHGNIQPESAVKRSEISAVVMRMIDTSVRVKKSGGTSSSSSSSASSSSSSSSTVGNVTTQTVANKLSLYPGSKKAQNITGISGIGADFTVANGAVTVDSACMLSLAANVELEENCLSFRLYEGCGYESLSIARGWLDNAAVGINGTAVNEIADKYYAINSLSYLYVNGNRIPITQLWYAEHTDAAGDNYTTYAFYFDTKLDLSSVYDVKFLAGMQDSVILEASGLTELSNLNKSTSVPIYTSPTESAGTSSAYSTAVNDAKAGAAEILYSYEAARCTILYGRGLYGSSASEYRLIMIFQNGNSQTIYTGQLDGIRVNATGSVLYYTVLGPDGKSIDYGVNFD